MPASLDKTSPISFSRSLRTIDHALQKGDLIRSDLKVVEKHGIKWAWVVFIKTLITAFTFCFNNDPWKAYRIRSVVHSLELFVRNNHEHMNPNIKKRVDRILNQLKVKAGRTHKRRGISLHAIRLFQNGLKTTQVPSGNIQKVRAAALSFGNNIAQLLNQKESFGCAPLGLMTILTIALHIIKPANKAQFIEKLGLAGLSEQDVQQAMAALLAGLEFPKTYSEGTISFYQALGFKKDVVVAQSLQNLITQVYGGDIIESDNLETEANDWAAAKTQSKIPSMVLSDNLSQFVILNASYIKLSWQDPFVKPSNGWPVEKFTCSDGSTADVSMMEQDNNFTIFLGSSFDMITLPYFSIDERMLSMLIFLPRDPAHLHGLHKALGSARPETLQSFRENDNKPYVKLYLPKTRLACEIHLLKAFKAMGLPLNDIDETVVSGGAVSDIVHVNCISTDENGTEAGAVSGITTKAAAQEPAELIFNINRAYTFIVADQENTVYFRGLVADKTALVVDP